MEVNTSILPDSLKKINLFNHWVKPNKFLPSSKKIASECLGWSDFNFLDTEDLVTWDNNEQLKDIILDVKRVQHLHISKMNNSYNILPHKNHILKALNTRKTCNGFKCCFHVDLLQLTQSAI